MGSYFLNLFSPETYEAYLNSSSGQIVPAAVSEVAEEEAAVSRVLETGSGIANSVGGRIMVLRLDGAGGLIDSTEVKLTGGGAVSRVFRKSGWGAISVLGGPECTYETLYAFSGRTFKVSWYSLVEVDARSETTRHPVRYEPLDGGPAVFLASDSQAGRQIIQRLDTGAEVLTCEDPTGR